jgi:CheY-like chemotaxis protein
MSPKLLLADDSIHYQKIVKLIFADEGVEVVCVNNGREAIERLEVFLPDVVLADVFMPLMNGYEVCEYIKQNEKFKHIPVMLLVGSFEPFDEEEARRVGANDTLTKPFQSIRRLMDKVGLLTSKRPPEEQIPTAELPRAEEPEPEQLTEAEIAITTADTQPLPAGLSNFVEEAAASQAKKEGMQSAASAPMVGAGPAVRPVGARHAVPLQETKKYAGAADVLLDLGDYQAGHAGSDDEFVLDIDLDEVPEASPVEAAFPSSAFRNRDRYRSTAVVGVVSDGASQSPAKIRSQAPAAATGELKTTPESQRDLGKTNDESVLKTPVEAAAESNHTAPAPNAEYSSESSANLAAVAAQQLSPEMIDAIARRAVEQLSEKVVEEIAWEVVPQLAELLIKKQLEEKSS